MIGQEAFCLQVARTAERFNIPGLAAAVMRGDDLRAAAAGVLNIRTNVGVTAASIFQIGSITKVFTATLVMQLVDAGTIDLDAPVRRYLPNLQIAGQPIVDTITVRALLAHTSGIAGDCFTDTSRNSDATRLYVDRCSELSYIHAPGRFSYCNSGYVVLGRLIEVIEGVAWVDQLRTHLLRPLGIEALTDAEDAPLFATAAGHVLDAAGAVELTPTPYLPRSTEAAGARLSMSATELLEFARMHLCDGRAADGTRLLSARSAKAMREKQIDLPFSFASNLGYGLGWALRGPADPTGFGHNGATVGQSAFLIVFPEFDLAIATLTNVSSGNATKAFDEIAHAVVDSLGGGAWPSELRRDDTLQPAPGLAGRYETQMSVITVRGAGAELNATVGARNDDDFGALPDHHFTLQPIGLHSFLAIDRVDDGRSVVGFTDFAGGVPQYAFWGGRLAKRVAGV